MYTKITMISNIQPIQYGIKYKTCTMYNQYTMKIHVHTHSEHCTLNTAHCTHSNILVHCTTFWIIIKGDCGRENSIQEDTLYPHTNLCIHSIVNCISAYEQTWNSQKLWRVLQILPLFFIPDPGLKYFAWNLVHTKYMHCTLYYCEDILICIYILCNREKCCHYYCYLLLLLVLVVLLCTQCWGWNVLYCKLCFVTCIFYERKT